jgi:metallo-beta-lactamase family protein
VQRSERFDPKPERVFVVHGDADIAPAFADELRAKGFTAEAPLFTACFDLAAGVGLQEGYMPERRRTEQRKRADAIFDRLVAAAEELLRFIKGSRGMANKDMASLTSQIHALLEKWK